MFALALFSFGYTGLYAAVSMIGIYVEAAIILLAAGFALLWLRNKAWLKAITDMSWVLYLPSILSFSRFDLLMAAGSPLNFGNFSSGLPSDAILIIGIALICGELLLRTHSCLTRGRDNFLKRGADEKEVRDALYRNAAFEAKMIAASAITALLIAVVVPVVEPALFLVLRYVDFAYILFGIAAAFTLVAIILIYTRPIKNSEKG
jgi:small-conductance mechanosensitive channel